MRHILFPYCSISDKPEQEKHNNGRRESSDPLLCVRREFRELSETQRQEYISAVQCLRSKPSKISGIGSSSRFQDMTYTHSMALATAHATAIFLPWHRALLHAYTIVLEEDCGYTGPMV
nr:hypothetical protein HK105_000526 [Polyrhizophydium stewartii]